MGEIAFLSSDGKGNVGDRGDCGVLKPGVTISTCPLSSSSSTGTDFCSGHGTCTDATKSCECFPGWKGFNCELRGCPTGRAWFDEASSSNNAHAVVECSNRGACDATTGECTCQEGFEGTACQRLSCPESADGGICNGTGRCVSMREIGELTGVTYGADINSITLWDAGLVYGCKCDEREGNYTVYANNVLDPHLSVAGSGLNYLGYNCALQTCRKGPEKLCPTDTTSMETQTIVCTMATSTPTMEVQTLDCTLTSGTFTVTFDGETTNEIPFDASSASLKESLTNLNNIEDITVSYSSGTVACTSGGTNTITLTAVTNFGDIPEVTTNSSSITVNTTSAGSGHNNEFKLSYNGHTSTAIAISSTAEDLQTLISSIQTIGDVTVSYSTGTSACESGGTNTITVSFLTEFGDLPMLTSDQSSGITIAEENKGTKLAYECSNNGYCNRLTGECQCFSGYGSSDGNGNKGQLGDCSYRDVFLQK